MFFNAGFPVAQVVKNLPVMNRPSMLLRYYKMLIVHYPGNETVHNKL